jgi:hypothetical protein
MEVDTDQSPYALDSTTINLCLSLFPWARFRQREAAIKMHTLLGRLTHHSTVHEFNCESHRFAERGECEQKTGVKKTRKSRSGSHLRPCWVE